MTNPFGAQPRPASLSEFGLGYSGVLAEVLPGQSPAIVFDTSFKEVLPNGYAGIAAVHIYVEDVRILPVAEGDVPNEMLIGMINWQSGRGTGQQLVDLTRGNLITIGGTSHMGLKVQLVSSIAGEPLVAYSTKRVEATINWLGNSVNEAKITLPTVEIEEDIPSPFLRIPLQAKSMIAYSTDPTKLPGLIAEFSTAEDEDSAKYQTLNPNANGSDIVHGVNFVRFKSPEAMAVFASFELW